MIYLQNFCLINTNLKVISELKTYEIKFKTIQNLVSTNIHMNWKCWHYKLTDTKGGLIGVRMSPNLAQKGGWLLIINWRIKLSPNLTCLLSIWFDKMGPTSRWSFNFDFLKSLKCKLNYIWSNESIRVIWLSVMKSWLNL